MSLLFLALPACGSVSPSNGPGGTGGTAAGSDPGAAVAGNAQGSTNPPPSSASTGSGAAGSPAGPVTGAPSCSLSLRGADDEDPSCYDCSATLASGALILSMMCRSATQDDMALELDLPVNAATGSGATASSDIDLTVGNAETAVFYSVYAPGAAPACAVTLDVYEPAARSGLSARFSCPSLTLGAPGVGGQPVSVSGSIALPAPTLVTVDAGASPVDAGAPQEDAGSDGSASTCTLTVHGAYSTETLSGVAGVYPGSPAAYVQCSAVSANGVGYSAINVGFVVVSGNTWCGPDCTAQYALPAGGQCTNTVTRNDGPPGGRYAGSYACERLTAPDGTVVSMSATVDAVISSPPQ